MRGALKTRSLATVLQPSRKKTILQCFLLIFLIFFFSGPMICIGREIQCLPYAGFFSPQQVFYDPLHNYRAVGMSDLYFAYLKLHPNLMTKENDNNIARK